MSQHTITRGNLQFEIETDFAIDPSLGRVQFVATVVRGGNGASLHLGEHWGATEQEALMRAVMHIDAQLARGGVRLAS